MEAQDAAAMDNFSGMFRRMRNLSSSQTESVKEQEETRRTLARMESIEKSLQKTASIETLMQDLHGKLSNGTERNRGPRAFELFQAVGTAASLAVGLHNLLFGYKPRILTQASGSNLHSGSDQIGIFENSWQQSSLTSCMGFDTHQRLASGERDQTLPYPPDSSSAYYTESSGFGQTPTSSSYSNPEGSYYPKPYSSFEPQHIGSQYHTEDPGKNYHLTSFQLEQSQKSVDRVSLEPLCPYEITWPIFPTRPEPQIANCAKFFRTLSYLQAMGIGSFRTRSLFEFHRRPRSVKVIPAEKIHLGVFAIDSHLYLQEDLLFQCCTYPDEHVIYFLHWVRGLFIPG
jgi:hypothetical protein